MSLYKHFTVKDKHPHPTVSLSLWLSSSGIVATNKEGTKVMDSIKEKTMKNCKRWIREVFPCCKNWISKVCCSAWNNGDLKSCTRSRRHWIEACGLFISDPWNLIHETFWWWSTSKFSPLKITCYMLQSSLAILLLCTFLNYVIMCFIYRNNHKNLYHIDCILLNSEFHSSKSYKHFVINS